MTHFVSITRIFSPRTYKSQTTTFGFVYYRLTLLLILIKNTHGHYNEQLHGLCISVDRLFSGEEQSWGVRQ